MTGLATMLKVLLPEKEPILITENEMVGLVNLFYRVSNSIKWYQENRQSEERYRLFMIFIVSVLFLLSLVFVIIGVVLLIFSKPKEESETLPLKKPSELPS